MSGSLTSSFVKERVPKCPHHQIPCVVKTGTKANETQGKSFFLCNYPKERCSFNKSAADFEATICPAHKHTVELKAFAKKDGTLRCYYRCNFGKEQGVTWCGHTLLKSTSTSAFKDITNIHRDGSVTKSKDIEVLKAKNPSLTNENNRLKSKVFNIPLNAQVEPTSNNTISKNGEVLAHANTSAKESLKPSVSVVSASEDSSENTSSKNAFTSNDNHFKKPHNNVDVTTEKNRTSDQNVGASNNIIEIESSDEEEATQQTELILSVEEWKARIASQERLLARIGPSSVDGGKKIEKNVQHLKNKLHETRKRQESITAFLPKMPDNAQQHATKYTDPLPQMSAFQRAPLISGRMTQSKINEVGRITKEAIEHLHKSLDTCPAADTEAEDPKGLKVMLMTHQKQAMAWLLWRERQMPSGGILADDMGLGKTLTMISLSLKSLQDGRSKIKQCPEGSKLLFSCSTLIICPASLLHQWHKEIEKRVDRSQLKVAIYHGPNREKRINKLAAYDIVLTTYAIVSIEGKPFIENEKPKKAELSEWVDSTKPPRQSEGPIFKIFWRRIVLDEGHTIKNHKAGMSIATCSLEAESRWIVTGTPIQNKTLDLYSLIKFLRVSPFDEYKVWQREVDNKSISGTKRLNSLVSSFLLRRTKNQIDKKTGKPLVSLPSRTAILHKITLSKDESLVYDIIQKFSKNMFTQFLDNRKDAQPRNNQTTIKQTEMPQEVLGMTVEEALTMFGLRGVSAMNSGCLLVLVLRLRQCCGHLSLMCEPIDEEIRKREGIEVPFDEQFANMSVCQEEDSSRPQELLPSFSSTKITALTNCLKDLKESSKGKAKSVVVSQWTRMLDIVAAHLKRNGFKMEHINGSVNVKKRSDIVERFNNEVEPQVLLVSLKAGGVGLNLIGGSHLFLLDQHWNPALEDQACDRVYRVGQKNDVVIHRFLCVDTVEERIVKLQEQKKSIANSVLYGGKSQKLTLDDLKMLFGVSR